jgi:hypothetical protein
MLRLPYILPPNQLGLSNAGPTLSDPCLGSSSTTGHVSIHPSYSLRTSLTTLAVQRIERTAAPLGQYPPQERLHGFQLVQIEWLENSVNKAIQR